MKRLKIMKAYSVLWLFIYFLVNSNLEAMKVFFFATLTFNLAVLTVLVIGIIVIMRSSISLVMLAGTFGILAYKKDNLTFYLQGIDKIMPANIAHMFHSRAKKGVLLFTSEESRAVVEWIDEKFSHQNRYINYFIGTSLMIGLLGTFTGLLVSIDEMGKIILSLSGDIDLGQVIRDFAGPLGGMATGFGSSLFGVVSAIILGLMGYILNKNQESLIEGVEDWLKGRIINSGGQTAAAPLAIESGEQLPEQRSSFMDIFIDNIASLSTEMAKIAQTNERLHSITIASVQQARDEHEMSHKLFSDINQSLQKMDTNNATQSENITEVLLSLDEKINLNLQKIDTNNTAQSENITEVLVSLDNNNTNHSENLAKLLTSLDAKIETQLTILQNDISKEKLENIREEISGLSEILSKNEDLDDANFKDVISSISSLTQKVQDETLLLTSIERLSTIQVDELKEQNKKSELTLNKELQAQADSKALLEKQREILELLVGKNEESLEELKRISSISTNAGSFSVEGQTLAEINGDKPKGFFSKIFG